MFVRFRKMANGGFPPGATADGVSKRICQGRRSGHCGSRCRARPRCRWVIDDGRRLEPFRYKVMVVENARVGGGKVKQELVAYLGSIDATWLDSFWSTVCEAELFKLRIPTWRHQSLQERLDFWEGVLVRMGKIGDNRLSQEQRKALRRAIHKVVPWVTEPEKKELALLDAKQDFEDVRSGVAFTEQQTARLVGLRAATDKQIEDLRRLASSEAKALLHAGARVARLANHGP
jgi:hypothetical protein